jgi:DNA-binding response OmpR family regulator
VAIFTAGAAGELPLELPRAFTRLSGTVAQRPGSTLALRQVLTHYEIEFVSSAYEALRRLNSRAFDVYVLDYWIADWSGVSLCRDIRKLHPHVPICFYTAAAQPEKHKRAERAGANAYLVKPADLELLHAEISTLMQLRDRRNEAALREASSAIQQELRRA